MGTSLSGWTTLAEEPLVLVREYGFGSGLANTLAIGLPNRKLMLVSPPVGLAASELQALAAHGEVVAMIAINGSHHLGIGPCRSVFPNAVSYAMPAARDRILKKGKDAGQLASIEALQPLLGDKVKVVAAPGCKIGDVIVRVETERGTLLYMGDFFANMQSLPKNLIFKLMFKLTDSGPGFKVFGIFFKFFASDRRVLRDFLISEVEAGPPAIVVPGHGDVVVRPELGPAMVSMLRAAI